MSYFEDQKHYVQNASHAWSMTDLGDVTRFEVRSGDQWAQDGTTPKERSEVAASEKLAFGQTYKISFDLMIEAGARNTADWMTLFQVQSTFDAGEAGHSPGLALEMVGERMRFVTRHSSASISTDANTTYVRHYTDAADLERGHWYDFDIEVTIDPVGDGDLIVRRDGVLLFEYHGPLGFNDAVGPYLKQGVYRESSPEDFAVNYRDWTVSTGEDVGTEANAPAPALAPAPVQPDPIDAAIAAATRVQRGSVGADVFHAIKGDAVLGGAGNDTYHLWDATALIVEKPGEGLDTVIARFWGAATLADGLENLTLLSAGSTAGTGNALNNVITAGVAGAVLDGRGGDDILVGGAGADIFAIDAGNGSDTIVGFRSGWDVVRLQGHGITSFDQLLSRATQSGSDVRLSLAQGETLVLRDTALTQLGAADFNLAMPRGEAVAGARDMVGPGRGYNAHGWYVLNNAWNPGTLQHGRDYSIDSSFSTADMTAGTTFNWTFPQVASSSTIRAYPQVIFGVPPKGAYANNPTDTARVFPVKVADIVGLTADYDVSYAGNTAGFNVSYDIWLTSVPNGDRSTLTNEVMVWVHKGSFEPYGQVVGTYSNGAFTGTIYHSGTYTAIVADRDVPVGQLDIADVLDRLGELGIVSPDEYLASVELGAEVVSGIGSLTINNLDLTLRTQAPGSDVVVTKEVTGAGTTVTEQLVVMPAEPPAEPPVEPAPDPTPVPEPVIPPAPVTPPAPVVEVPIVPPVVTPAPTPAPVDVSPPLPPVIEVPVQVPVVVPVLPVVGTPPPLPPLPLAIALSTDEAHASNGNLLGVGTPAGTAVAAVNGVAANVGQRVVLASGALLTVAADGTYSYNPNGRFNALTAAGSGATNLSATDGFSYTATNGVTTVVTVTVTGLAGKGDTLAGDVLDNAIAGGARDDLLDASAGGDDTLVGGGGNDGFYMGAALTAADHIDGGLGASDQVGIQGDYRGARALTLGDASLVGVETLVLLSGADTRFGDRGDHRYGYDLTSVDANVAAGAMLIVNATTLRADETFTFDGSAESDGGFWFFGGLGADHLTGSATTDAFYFGIDGRFGAEDRVDGGAGNGDQLGLQGNYAITLGADQLAGIETIVLLSAGDRRFGDGRGHFAYDLTLDDGNVAAGEMLTINANGLRADETAWIHGGAEVDGRLRMYGGAGGDRFVGGARADHLVGGAGDDTLHGGLGADRLEGGVGADTFTYLAAAESTGATYDTIVGFDIAADRLDLAGTGADYLLNGAVTVGSLSKATFDVNLAGLLDGLLTADGAAVVTANKGNLAGQRFLVVDGNDVAGYQAGEDYVFQLAGTAEPIVALDFIV